MESGIKDMDIVTNICALAYHVSSDTTNTVFIDTMVDVRAGARSDGGQTAGAPAVAPPVAPPVAPYIGGWSTVEARRAYSFNIPNLVAR